MAKDGIGRCDGRHKMIDLDFRANGNPLWNGVSRVLVRRVGCERTGEKFDLYA